MGSHAFTLLAPSTRISGAQRKPPVTLVPVRDAVVSGNRGRGQIQAFRSLFMRLNVKLNNQVPIEFSLIRNVHLYGPVS